MQDQISGIQQIGIGVRDARSALIHYAKTFGMDALVFDDTSEAKLMTQYTGGRVYRRRAILSMNMQGGGGLEIWQFLDRQPKVILDPLLPGDIGIFAGKVKCRDLFLAQKLCREATDIDTSEIFKDREEKRFFWVRDPFKNMFQVVQGRDWFQNKGKVFGGIVGAVIGVSDMEAAVNFYNTLLNIQTDHHVYTERITVPFSSQHVKCRKVVLRKDPAGGGAFAKLLGSIEIELIQNIEGKARRIFDNRYWGDCGFIHLCFDVLDMSKLKTTLGAKNFPFTVDSEDSFSMEGSAGRFCYVEDPDGTLIELVETHRVPIVKKLGWYLNLKKRNPEKPLPDFFVKLLGLRKVK